MGTRHLTCVYHEGKYKVAQYGQFDGYPEGQGVHILEFLGGGFYLPDFLAGLAKCRFAREDEVEAKWREAGKPAGEEWVDGKVAAQLKKLYPALSRDTGSDILRLVQASGEPDTDAGKVKELLLVDNLEFAADGLFCEWVWVIDLDNGTFGGYKGFQKEPLPEGERFAFLNGKNPKQPREDVQYQPPKLVAAWPLDALPDKDAFLKAFGRKDEEG